MTGGFERRPAGAGERGEGPSEGGRPRRRAPLLGTIRSKLLVPAVALVVTVASGVGLAAALEARRRAEERVRTEIGRTVRVVLDGGFLFAPETLRHIARFLGAEVATVRAGGSIAVTTLAPARERALEEALEKGSLPAGPAGRPTVAETRMGTEPVTIVLADVHRSGMELALVYPGHILSEARFEALRPGLVVAGVGLLLAAAAAALLARSFVRPIEALSSAARRIEQGDLGARLEVRTGDELEALARSLERMVRGLRAAEGRAREAEKLAALGRVLTALAHEVKNPLAALRMTAELLAERAKGADQREAAELVLEEIERLGLFAAKLLAYARRPALAPRPASLAGIAAEVGRLLARHLDHVGARLEISDGGGAPDALVDEIAFRHVIMNLVLNAADAMPSGGTIRVSLAAKGGGRLRLEVADDGAGVLPADVPRLFEPFFSRKPGGTGLGLAMCRTIVEAHGGRIAYAPRSPGGSRFTVEVPAAPPRPAALAAAGGMAREGA